MARSVRKPQAPVQPPPKPTPTAPRRRRAVAPVKESLAKEAIAAVEVSRLARAFAAWVGSGAEIVLTPDGDGVLIGVQPVVGGAYMEQRADSVDALAIENAALLLYGLWSGYYRAEAEATLNRYEVLQEG